MILNKFLNQLGKQLAKQVKNYFNKSRATTAAFENLGKNFPGTSKDLADKEKIFSNSLKTVEYKVIKKTK